jgi:hypothetical protein
MLMIATVRDMSPAPIEGSWHASRLAKPKGKFTCGKEVSVPNAAEMRAALGLSLIPEAAAFGLATGRSEHGSRGHSLRHCGRNPRQAGRRAAIGRQRSTRDHAAFPPARSLTSALSSIDVAPRLGQLPARMGGHDKDRGADPGDRPLGRGLGDVREEPPASASGLRYELRVSRLSHGGRLEVTPRSVRF